MPLRNAEHVLPMAFYNLMNLTYDHRLIDIAFWFRIVHQMTPRWKLF